MTAGPTMAAIKMGISLETAVGFHLTSRHFPPIGFMQDACVKAIKLAKEGRENEYVALPAGTTYRGAPEAPASAIIEGHHLEVFLEDPEDYNWDGFPKDYELIVVDEGG